MASAIEWNEALVKDLVKAGIVLVIVVGIFALAFFGLGVGVIGAVGAAMTPLLVGL